MGFFRRKKVAKPEVVVEAGFRRPTGRHYLETLKDMHERLAPGWYLEVGTNKGNSLELARCNAVAIDPEFKIRADVFRGPPQLHLFQATSDDFFATDFLTRNDIRIDFAFLDGMHLFEFLLRDFINTEKAAGPQSVITMHDCLPSNRLQEDRNWDYAKTREWTGDVWKILPILRQYRPDLRVEVLDSAPTALVMVTQTDSANDALTRNMAAILAEWTGQGLEDYGLDRFAADFPLISEQDRVQRLAVPAG